MAKNKDLRIVKLTGGLGEEDSIRIEHFFSELDEHIDLPMVSHDMLINHFVKAFEYYLDNGYKPDKIIEFLDISNLGDYYKGKKRRFFFLDNAAIVYPLGMKFGQMPIFRLSVELKENIVPELLQIALDFTIKRFPVFSAVIKNGFFWHYLESTNNVPEINEENDIPCKPISIILRTKSSIRVLYYKKRISIEFFHVITDGNGGLIFLKTLLGEYLRLKGIDVVKNNGVLDINEEPKEEEFVNEFANEKGEGDFSTFVDKKSVQLSGKLSNLNLTKIIHFKLASDDLKEVSKKYGGTVTAYILSLIFLAAKKDSIKKEGLFNIQVPINMRKFNGSRTLRNYSMYFNASMDLKDVDDRSELVKEMGKQIKEKGSEKLMRQMMQTTGKLIRSLAYVPLSLKIPVMQIVYGYLGNSIIGCTLSNLGMIQADESLSKQIDSFEFIIVPGKPNRVSATLVSVNNTTVLTIAKANRETVFEDEIYNLMKEDGLKVEVEGSVDYES